MENWKRKKMTKLDFVKENVLLWRAGWMNGTDKCYNVNLRKGTRYPSTLPTMHPSAMASATDQGPDTTAHTDQLFFFCFLCGVGNSGYLHWVVAMETNITSLYIFRLVSPLREKGKRCTSEVYFSVISNKLSGYTQLLICHIRVHIWRDCCWKICRVCVFLLTSLKETGQGHI